MLVKIKMVVLLMLAIRFLNWSTKRTTDGHARHVWFPNSWNIILWVYRIDTITSALPMSLNQSLFNIGFCHQSCAMFKEGSFIWIHSFFEKIKKESQRNCWCLPDCQERNTSHTEFNLTRCPAWKQGVGPHQTMQFHTSKASACFPVLWYNFEKQRRKDEFLVSKQE